MKRKKTYLKSILREIKGSFGRFMAILSIVALGVGFLVGVLSATPDMKYSVGRYYKDNNMTDIFIKGTLGLTEEDMEAIRKVEGVKTLMPAYVTDVLMETEDAQVLVTRDYGLPMDKNGTEEFVNILTLVEGRMPEAADECVVQKPVGSLQAPAIGSRIRISPENESYEDRADTYRKDSYRVVGVVSNPFYFSTEKEQSTIGDGKVAMVIYTPESSYALDVYTDFYILLEDSEKLEAFSDSYEAYVEEIVEQIEDIAHVRVQLRYEEVLKEANEKLDDAKEEYAGEKEKAQRELADAEKELEEGRRKVEDGKQQIADGEAKIAANEQEAAKGEQELAEAKEELDDAYRQLYENEAAVFSGEQELAQGQAQLDEGWGQFHAGEQQLAEGKAQLEAQAAQLTGQEEALTAQETQFAAAEEEIAASEAALSDQEAQLLVAEQQLEAGKAQLEAQEEALLAAEVSGIMEPEELEAMRQQLAAAKEQLARGMEELEGNKAKLAAAREQLAAGKAALEENRDRLAEARGQIEAGKTQIAAAREEIKEKESRLAEVGSMLRNQQDKIDASAAQLAEARSKLEAGWKEYEEGNSAYEDGKRELEEGRQQLTDARKELDQARADVTEGEADLAEGEAEYADAKAEAEEAFADAEAEISEAEAKIADIEEPEWYVLDRGSNVTYASYQINVEKVADVAKLFPVFFFLVSALVSLTTMARMVEEERIQIGTLKALGYKKSTIVAKYLLYCGLATVLGCALGIVGGFWVLPAVLNQAYRSLYDLPPFLIRINFSYAMISCLLQLFCTMAATYSACRKTMTEKPAILMLPKAPKAGQRILLERVKPLWKRMNFSWKATCRNIFRYKRHLVMTIVGIAGCTALVFVGFGLRDSMKDVAQTQFEQIWQYDVKVGIQDGALEAARDEDPLSQLLSESDSMLADGQVMQAEDERGQETVTVTVMVPEEAAILPEFVALQDREDKSPVAFDEKSVVLTEKLAGLLQVQTGDSVVLENADKESRSFVVTGITENYTGGYVYMGIQVYEQAFGAFIPNTLLARSQARTQEEQDAFSEWLLSDDGVSSVEFLSQTQVSYENLLGSINFIVVVLILCAGALAAIVLYNLTNMNINERIRELATLRVLGYHHVEVAGYIFREISVMSLMGTAVGLVAGWFLHRYIIITSESIEMMFGRHIELSSYLLSAAVTMGFTFLVEMVMTRKLRRIKMAESLKSVE